MSKNEIIAWLQKVLAGDVPALSRNDGQFITDVLELADWHGVTALIHHKLSAENNLEYYSAEFKRQLTARNKRNIAGILLWKQEITNIYNSLHNANIRLLLVKGFPLSYTLYPEPHLRIYSDIDILFPEYESVERAWNILQETGYTRPVIVSGKYISHQFSCYRTGTSGFSFALDLHWRISNHNFFANALTFDELESSSIPLTGIEQEMRTLSPEYALLFACMHRVAHIPFGEADRLAWLYDIHLLAESFNSGQWTFFSELAKKKDLSSVCRDGLLNSRERFKTKLPEDYLGMLQREGTDDPVQPVSLTSAWKYQLVNFKTMPGWTERVGLLREYLLPPAEYMLAKYKTDKKWLLPYLYIKRIVGGLKRFLNRNN